MDPYKPTDDMLETLRAAVERVEAMTDDEYAAALEIVQRDPSGIDWGVVVRNARAVHGDEVINALIKKERRLAAARRAGSLSVAEPNIPGWINGIADDV